MNMNSNMLATYDAFARPASKIRVNDFAVEQDRSLTMLLTALCIKPQNMFDII